MCLKLWFEDFVIGSGFEYPWAHAYNVAPLSVHIGSRQSMLAPAQGPHDTIALFHASVSRPFTHVHYVNVNVPILLHQSIHVTLLTSSKCTCTLHF